VAGVKHAFTNPKADGADATITRPSDWNADHTVADLVTTGKTALQGDISPAQLTANTDDWAPTGLAGASIIRFSTDASRNITGLTGGEDGRVIVLINVGSNNAVLMHDVTSTAANRFFCPNNVDFTLGPKDVVVIEYDATDSRWRVSTSVAAMTGHVAAADPHVGYILESLFDAAGDLLTATADNTPSRLARGADDTFLRATGSTIAFEAIDFSIGALLEGAPPTNGFRMIWRAPFACTVTAVRSHFDAGTNCVVNARKNQASDFMSADFTNSTANAWGAGTVNQNQSIAAGDDIEIELVSTSGAVTKVNIQVDLTRP
jgi:hypothetical protein